MKRAALAMLALAITAHYAWNAWSVTPLTGYDAPGHADYMLTILEEGRLPHPYQGWSTFHPPIYYVLGAGVWHVLEPLGPQAVVAGIRGIGVLSLLCVGAVAFALARRRAGDGVAAVAAATLLLVPCIQLTGAMIRNEALAAAFAALAIAPILSLQRNPRNAAAAAAAGLLVGLAIATKVNAVFLLAGCAMPFFRPNLDRRALRSALLVFGLATLIAAPVTIRNLMLTGDPLPLNRDKPVAALSEASQVVRERRVLDYAWLDPRCLWRPSIHHVPGDPPPPAPHRNVDMTNVWGLTYASTWYDAFGHRIPLAFHRDGVWAGRLLALLGLIPTGAMLFGFARASSEALRWHGESDDAPLVAMAWAGLVAFVSFTYVSPTIGAPKAIYLLPVAVPATLFFVRCVQSLPAVARGVVLAGSAAAALASALVFTQHLWFPPIGPEVMAGRWQLVGRALPDSHIVEAIERLVLARIDGSDPG
jgi:4-amino-4-deoxy-L-arabinose transferase-like glycosyltransferase